MEIPLLIEIVFQYLDGRDVWCEQTLGKPLSCRTERYTFSLDGCSTGRNRGLCIQNLGR